LRNNCNETQSPAGRAGEQHDHESEMNALCPNLAPFLVG
jgi:hypothetical protein